MSKRKIKRKHSDITDASQSEDSESEKESENQGVASSGAEKQTTSQSNTPEAEAMEVEERGKDSSSNSPAVSQTKDSEKSGGKQVDQSGGGKQRSKKPSQSKQRLFTVQVTKVRISLPFFHYYM